MAESSCGESSLVVEAGARCASTRTLCISGAGLSASAWLVLVRQRSCSTYRSQSRVARPIGRTSTFDSDRRRLQASAPFPRIVVHGSITGPADHVGSASVSAISTTCMRSTSKRLLELPAGVSALATADELDCRSRSPGHRRGSAEGSLAGEIPPTLRNSQSRVRADKRIGKRASVRRQAHGKAVSAVRVLFGSRFVDRLGLRSVPTLKRDELDRRPRPNP